jgi:hypothetical protein
VSYEPRKVVGKLKPQSPFARLEQLNRFLRSLLPEGKEPVNPAKDGSWPVRKVVGRSKSR